MRTSDNIPGRFREGMEKHLVENGHFYSLDDWEEWHKEKFAAYTVWDWGAFVVVTGVFEGKTRHLHILDLYGKGYIRAFPQYLAFYVSVARTLGCTSIEGETERPGLLRLYRQGGAKHISSTYRVEVPDGE